METKLIMIVTSVIVVVLLFLYVGLIFFDNYLHKCEIEDRMSRGGCP